MIYAFADPPYPGCAHRYPENEEVDHKALIEGMEAHYDGWALCTSSSTLQELLLLCPSDVRIGAWCKSFAVFKPNVNPAYCWEPVIYRNPRNQRVRTEPTVRDWIVAPITLQRGLVGAKPDAFNRWIIELLGMTEDDVLDDLFPGTNGLMKAWGEITQPQLFTGAGNTQERWGYDQLPYVTRRPAQSHLRQAEAR